MNRKQALLIIAGLGSVLCNNPVTKEISVKSEKISSIIEPKGVKELKVSILPEKTKKTSLLPLKKEPEKNSVCMEKIASSVNLHNGNEKSEKPLPKIVKKPLSRIIEFSNNITKDMITYKKHWTGNYTPSKFILKINGQEVKQDSTAPITVTDNKMSASFNYEFRVFGKVQRVGGREFDVIIPENADKLTSTFSWDAPSNLVLNKGTLINSRDL